MRERTPLSRSLVAAAAAICTLGALAIVPVVNATIGAAIAPEQTSASEAKATGKAGFVKLQQCPADNPSNVNNPNEMVYVTPDPNDVGGTLNVGKYVPGLTEALTAAKEYAAQGHTDVYVDLVGHQNVPSPDKNNPKTLDVNAKIHLNGQGCRLDGQLNFGTGADGSTVKNVDFRMTSPNQNTANILTSVPVTVENNLFRLPNASASLQDTGNRPANAKRPVGVVIGGGTGSIVRNNLFQSDSDTGEAAHEQVQGVRLGYASAGTVVSNNQFDVPIGVALFGFTGTGDIKDNVFTGKYAVADAHASNPGGLTYLGPIVYGTPQDVNGNELGNAWPYRGVFTGNTSTAAGAGRFEGTSYGVKYLYTNKTTGNVETLGADTVVKATTPTRIPTRTGYTAELYTDAALQTKFNPATDMTNNRDGNGQDGVTSNDLGALYVKWVQTVTYDKNGASGTAPAAVTLDEGDKIAALPGADGMTAPAGKSKFLGWSTDSGATTADHEANAEFTPTGDVTLYAIWAPAQYTVSYDANSGQGGQGTVASTTVDEGQSVTVAKGDTLTNTNPDLKFDGWTTNADGTGASYAADATFTPTGDVTLYAKWVAKTKYTVSYDANGGSGEVPAPQQVNEDSEVEASAPSDKLIPPTADQKFGGWKTDPNGTTAEYAAGDPVPVAQADVTLYAHWIAKTKYTVSYDANGGSGEVPAPQSVNENSSVAASDPGAKLVAPDEDHKFDGWNTAADGSGTKYAVGAQVPVAQADVTLYAQWVAKTKYTVSYDANGGSGEVPASQQVNEDSSVEAVDPGAKLVAPDKDHKFGGWKTDPKGAKAEYAVGAQVPVAQADVTLYAHWIEKTKYTVSYDANGGKGTVASTTVNEGDSVTVAKGDALTNDNADLKFGGWNTVADGSGTAHVADATFTPTGNVTLYAQWVAKTKYTVTYDANGGTGGLPAKSTVNEGDEVTVAQQGNLTNDNADLKFAGWNTEADGHGQAYAADEKFVPTGNVTLYAQWVAKTKYTVTYDANGGTGEVPAPQTVNEGDEVTVAQQGNLTNANQDLKFAGWATSPDGTGDQYQPDATFTPTSDVTLYAQWVAKTKYTVSYNANGGAGTVASSTVNEGDAVTVAKGDALTNANADLKFAGWNTEADGSGTAYAVDATFTPTSDVTLYAQWVAKDKFTVSYEANGGSGEVPAPQTVNEDSEVAAADPGDKLVAPDADHKFGGWKTDPNGTTAKYAVGNPVKVDRANVTLYAHWIAKDKFTVSYEANGGSGEVPAPQTVNEDSEVAAADPGDKLVAPDADHKFGGWNTAADGSGTKYAVGAQVPVAQADVTLYAQWVAKDKYTVSYDANGGTGDLPGNTTVNEGDEVTLAQPNALANANPDLKFAGWATNADGTGDLYQPGEKFTPTGSVTLYAKWVAKDKYTVSYDANGGSGEVPAPQQVNEGSSVAAADPGDKLLAPDGMQFGGWKTDPKGTKAEFAAGDPVSVGKADVTLYAHWIPKTDNGSNVPPSNDNKPATDNTPAADGTHNTTQNAQNAASNRKLASTGMSVPLAVVALSLAMLAMAAIAYGVRRHLRNR